MKFEWTRTRPAKFRPFLLAATALLGICLLGLFEVTVWSARKAEIKLILLVRGWDGATPGKATVTVPFLDTTKAPRVAETDDSGKLDKSFTFNVESDYLITITHPGYATATRRLTSEQLTAADDEHQGTLDFTAEPIILTSLAQATPTVSPTASPTVSPASSPTPTPERNLVKLVSDGLSYTWDATTSVLRTIATWLARVLFGIGLLCVGLIALTAFARHKKLPLSDSLARRASWLAERLRLEPEKTPPPSVAHLPTPSADGKPEAAAAGVNTQSPSAATTPVMDDAMTADVSAIKGDVAEMKETIGEMSKAILDIQEFIENFPRPASPEPEPRPSAEAAQVAEVGLAPDTNGIRNATTDGRGTERHAQDGTSEVQSFYKKLQAELESGLPPTYEPIYLNAEVKSTQTEAVEKKKIFLTKSDAFGTFVLFTDSRGGQWVFPNPNPKLPFKQALKPLFPHLTEDNFEQMRKAVTPKPATELGENCWSVERL